MTAIVPTPLPSLQRGQHLGGLAYSQYTCSPTNGQTVLTGQLSSAFNTLNPLADEQVIGPHLVLEYTDANQAGVFGYAETTGSFTFIVPSTTAALILHFFAPSNLALAAGTATPTLVNDETTRKFLVGANLEVVHFATISTGDTFDYPDTPTRYGLEMTVSSGMKVAWSAGVFTFSVTSGPIVDVLLYIWKGQKGA